MKLGSLDPALACSGAMSTFSYDSHPVSRAHRQAGDLSLVQINPDTLLSLEEYACLTDTALVK